MEVDVVLLDMKRGVATGGFEEWPGVGAPDRASEVTEAMQTTETIHEKSIDPRTMRAATESMTTVLEAPGLIRVYSGTTADYLVDVVEGVCECDDYRYNGPEGGCKHLKRLEMELGERGIPDLPGKSDVELMVRARRNDVRSKAMTDGGTV